MEEYPMSTDDMSSAAHISPTGIGFVIRVAAASRKYQDWELIGPSGTWLLGGRAHESHEEALQAAYRLKADLYPSAAVEVAQPDASAT
jgi:hypothetical protein